MLTSLAPSSPLLSSLALEKEGQRYAHTHTHARTATLSASQPSKYTHIRTLTQRQTLRVVLTLNNERAVTSDQCLCRSMAWWSARRMGVTACGWHPLDTLEGGGERGEWGYWGWMGEVWRETEYSGDGQGCGLPSSLASKSLLEYWGRKD